MEKYEPSRTEVLAEMLIPYKNSFVFLRNLVSKQNLLEGGKSLKDGLVFGGCLLGFLALAPYTVPTVIREIKEIDRDNPWISGPSSAEELGGFVGGACGLGVDVGQVMGYYYLTTHNHSEILAVPVVTNLFSWFYERGRASYRNARKRLLEKRLTETSMGDLK